MRSFQICRTGSRLAGADSGFVGALFRDAGFEVVLTEDVTSNEVAVSRRWHTARQERASELIELEGEETFAGVQRFLATVHRLTDERRLSRFVYMSASQASN
jgi:hypothetical protein